MGLLLFLLPFSLTNGRCSPITNEMSPSLSKHGLFAVLFPKTTGPFVRQRYEAVINVPTNKCKIRKRYNIKVLF